MSEFPSVGAPAPPAQSLAAPPDHMMCPLTMELIVDPMIDPTTGITYDGGAIRAWLARKQESPTSGQVLTADRLVPNLALRNAIEEWRAAQGLPPPVGQVLSAAVEVRGPPPGSVAAVATPIDLTGADAIDLTNAPDPIDLTAPASPPRAEAAFWEFELDDGRWVRYDDDAGSAVEDAYANNSRGQVGLVARGTGYHVDLALMTQTNTSSGGTRRIRRSPPGGTRPHVIAAWEYEDGPRGSGAWRAYARTDAALVEAHAGGQVCLTRGSNTYFVDTVAMTQTNVDSDVVRRIRRR